MSITYGASTGSIITSPLVYETLGSQTGIGTDDVILATAAVTPSTHTNYGGNVGNNSTGLGPGDTYIGRRVVLRPGTATEEIKRCTAQVDNGATITVTMHEDWDIVPASGDYFAVGYSMDDIDQGGSGGGVSYASKEASFLFSNKLTIGNATDFAFLYLDEAGSMEINDSAGATDPDFEIKNNGMFSGGYLYGGKPTNGGYITSEQNADGEEVMDCDSGGYLRLIDTDFKVNLNDLKLRFDAGADVIMIGCKNYQFTYDCELLDGSYETIKWTGGSGGSSDVVRISDATTILDWILVSTGGFATESADTTTETLTIQEILFANNTDLITLVDNKTWDVINPSWDATTNSDFNDTAVTGTAAINDKRSVDVVVQESDGTKLQNALAIVYEGTTDNLVQELTTDADGIATGSFSYKAHSWTTGTGSTTTYANHAFRVDKWLYTPLAASQGSTEKISGTYTLSPDPNIVQTTQSTAKSDGSGITWNEDTNPSSIIDYTSGSGTLLVGMILTGGSSGAIGTVTQIVDGDSAAGTVHLETRNGTAFSAGETVNRTGGTAGTWSATYTSATQQDFSIWVDANSKSYQVQHDYFAALTSETTLTATGELIHEWGRDSQGRVVYKGSSGFYTERSNSKGVFIVNGGTGTVAYFTDDAGVTWTPPTSVTLSVTVLDEAGDGIVGAQTSIFLKDSPYTQLMNEDTISGGLATESYDYVSDVDVVVKVRKSDDLDDPRYIASSAIETITSSGLNKTVTLKVNPFL